MLNIFHSFHPVCGGYSLPTLEVVSEYVSKVMGFVNLKNAKWLD